MSARRIAFTSGATAGLNAVLQGWVRPGDSVWVSELEHNAVSRPLHRLGLAGVRIERLACDRLGTVCPVRLRDRLRSELPRLVIVNQASNVSGLLQPLDGIAEACAAQHVPLLVDTAQAAGSVPLGFDPAAQPCFVVLTAHKGLYGLAGCGALFASPELELPPLLLGGTGGDSLDPAMPEAWPAAQEAGSLNVLGIHALGAGLDWLEAQGIDRLRAAEEALEAELIVGLEEIPELEIVGRAPDRPSVPVVSVRLPDIEPAELGGLLDASFGIAVRSGLHCAPDAHRLLGTLPGGTTRISLGAFSSSADVQAVVAALREVAEELR